MADNKNMETIERFRSRIAESESMYKIVDSVFVEDSQLYIEHPEKLIEVLKECILPFRKTCKSLNSPCSGAVDGELVRLRCMIRESIGYECFPLEELKNSKNEKCCGFLRNAFEDEIQIQPTALKFGSRFKYVVMPVPGASKWYDETFYDIAVKEGNQSEGQVTSNGMKSSKIIAKFVDESGSDLRPNHIFDLFGIYDTTVLFDSELDDCDGNKVMYRHYNTLHVIAFEPVEDHKVLNQEFPLMSDINTGAISLIRKSLKLLFGDDISAEYLLCHLISKTYMRWSENPVCSMPLNIVNVTDAESIVRHLRLLMPKVVLFKITGDNLCTDNFVPKMNNALGMLEDDSVLPFSNGTVFVIDETDFTWSSILSISDEKRAIVNKNLKAMGTLAKEQVLEYDYTVYNVTLDCDVNVLILSKELSSLKLEAPFAVAIPKQFHDGVDPASVFEEPQSIRQCRHALQVCRNSVEDVSIPDQLNKSITDSFLHSRSRGMGTGVACDRLHRLLTLTRLCAAVDSTMEANVEHWRKAEKMEIKRTRGLEGFLRRWDK
uniref:Mini-chromosome maintenance complex-binding protein n=1 Tax=Syphacia muris TaxID=451379 RepID=A0A158R668_9BILA